MSPNAPLLVVPRCTFLVVPGRTFLVVPRLATTLLSAATPASTKLHDSLRLAFFVIITEEGAEFALGSLEKTSGSALSASRRAVECALGIRK